MNLKKIPQARKLIERFLTAHTFGFLGMSNGEEPYVLPLTYAYLPGRILFHCALSGRKLNFLRANPRVCFTVGVQSGKTVHHTYGAQCRSEHDSVVCFGRAGIIENPAERRRTLQAFNRKLTRRPKPISLKAAEQCLAVVITIERATLRQKRRGTEWFEGECVFRR